MPKTAFIYLLKCPTTGAVRYVGKATNPKRRFEFHCAQTQKFKSHLGYWVRSVLHQNRRPVLEVIDEVPETEWPAWEVAYIDFFREQGFDLVNGTNGGEGAAGTTHSEETRAKLRVFHTGLKASPETRANMSFAHVGHKQSNNTSGFVGVVWCPKRKKWQAQLKWHTKYLFLGRFSKLEDAVFVRALAVDKFFNSVSR